MLSHRNPHSMMRTGSATCCNALLMQSSFCSQPKDLYRQQLATLFNTKLLQIPVKINQVVSAHLQIRDHGKLRDMMVAVEDLQLVQY